MAKHSDYPHLIRKAAVDEAAGTMSHPWNPNSQISGSHLSKLGGLERTGVSIVHIAPGKESFAYHSHHREEEWIYILSGTAVALIDGKEYELHAGDFVAFPTPSVAHHLFNRSAEQLTYMMGGENLSCEVADFPTLDRRMVKLKGEVSIYKLSDAKTLADPL
jgi:uncharacterized cupin superfamily protein